MSEWYWLVDGEVVPAPAGKPMQPDGERRIALDYLGANGGDPSVSTVFLGLDHGWGDGAPVVFETMVFWYGNPLDNECERYTSLDEARAGHAAMVERVKFVLAASFAGAEPARADDT